MADNQLRIAQPELPLLQIVLSPPSAEILTPAGENIGYLFTVCNFPLILFNSTWLKYIS